MARLEITVEVSAEIAMFGLSHGDERGVSFNNQAEIVIPPLRPSALAAPR
jgi:hypothetical protein